MVSAAGTAATITVRFRTAPHGDVFDYHEPQTMLGDQSTLARVVEAALFSAADPRDGLAAVEQGRRLRVLFLLEFDDQSQARPVPVDGKPRAPAPFGRRVSSEPVEGRLTAPPRPEDLVA